MTPSEWEETFGFTVLEGLSYGIPVIVSNKVGAKDLITEGKNGYVVEGNVQSLKNCILRLIENPQSIKEMNAYIVNEFPVKTMTEHSREIDNLYQMGRKRI